jgi:hypothetical protein
MHKSGVQVLICVHAHERVHKEIEHLTPESYSYRRVTDFHHECLGTHAHRSSALSHTCLLACVSPQLGEQNAALLVPGIRRQDEPESGPLAGP